MAEASSRGGPVPSLGSHMPRDPLRRLAGSSFRGDSCHVGEGGLVAVSLRDLLPGASPVAALFANSSTTSLPLAPLCAGTHLVVSSSSFLRMREQTSAMRWTGPMVSLLIRSMADVESTKTVCRCPLAVAGQGRARPGRWRRPPHRRPPCWRPDGSGVQSTSWVCSRHRLPPPCHRPVESRRFRLCLGVSTRLRPGGDCPLVHNDVAGEAACLAPLLCLCGPVPANGSRRPEACGEG